MSRASLREYRSMLPSRAAILSYLTILSGSAGRLVISLVYFLIVANTLTLGEFGLFATASSTGLILSRLLAFGFGLKGIGIWCGLAAGLGMVAVLMTLRWRRHLAAHVAACAAAA